MRAGGAGRAQRQAQGAAAGLRAEEGDGPAGARAGQGLGQVEGRLRQPGRRVAHDTAEPQLLRNVPTNHRG